MAIFESALVRAALRRAWLDSAPGPTGGHEEGGFIVADANETLSVVRWNIGKQDTIELPLHPGCRLDSIPIIASFHTHPNTGSDYVQSPSISDIRGVTDDPDLKGELYIGEYVISLDWVYLITPSGQVDVIGSTSELLFEDPEG